MPGRTKITFNRRKKGTHVSSSQSEKKANEKQMVKEMREKVSDERMVTTKRKRTTNDKFVYKKRKTSSSEKEPLPLPKPQQENASPLVKSKGTKLSTPKTTKAQTKARTHSKPTSGSVATSEDFKFIQNILRKHLNESEKTKVSQSQMYVKSFLKKFVSEFEVEYLHYERQESALILRRNRYLECETRQKFSDLNLLVETLQNSCERFFFLSLFFLFFFLFFFSLLIITFYPLNNISESNKKLKNGIAYEHANSNLFKKKKTIVILNHLMIIVKF
jgi:hypothetical protein